MNDEMDLDERLRVAFSAREDRAGELQLALSDVSPRGRTPRSRRVAWSGACVALIAIIAAITIVFAQDSSQPTAESITSAPEESSVTPESSSSTSQEQPTVTTAATEPVKLNPVDADAVAELESLIRTTLESGSIVPSVVGPFGTWVPSLAQQGTALTVRITASDGKVLFAVNYSKGSQVRDVNDILDGSTPLELKFPGPNMQAASRTERRADNGAVIQNEVIIQTSGDGGSPRVVDVWVTADVPTDELAAFASYLVEAFKL